MFFKLSKKIKEATKNILKILLIANQNQTMKQSNEENLRDNTFGGFVPS